MKEATVAVREAAQADLDAIHRIRLSVRENVLSDPAKITVQAYMLYLNARSLWVAEIGSAIVGFAAIDSDRNSVWALFVDPMREGSGAGRALHKHMLQWARHRGMRKLVLTTGPGTRAERFYRRLGWSEVVGSLDADLLFERHL